MAQSQKATLSRPIGSAIPTESRRPASDYRTPTKGEPSRWTPYALPALRFFVGLTFVEHGTHKYFNFPAGPSFAGINLTTLHGWAGMIELFAGAHILVGLFTRPAAFLGAGEMASVTS
jgi:uncharacterized membrane protein YphA (DoxX/SURF4 family)